MDTVIYRVFDPGVGTYGHLDEQKGNVLSRTEATAEWLYRFPKGWCVVDRLGSGVSFCPCGQVLVVFQDGEEPDDH